VAVLGHERKAQSWLREKMPSAFFRMSRSWRRISTSRAETPDFLFLSRLMTAAGKGLLTLLSEELTPMVKRTVGNPQIAGNLGQRFGAGFHQLNRFQFELFRKRSLGLLHGLFPSRSMSTSSSLPSPLSRVKTRWRLLLASSVQRLSLRLEEEKEVLSSAPFHHFTTIIEKICSCLISISAFLFPSK
jgi:hypothetical protein